MIINRPGKTPSSNSKLTRSLLAGTCLTVACGTTAVAGTITENSGPTGEFGKGLGSATVLPVGTTSVEGFLNRSLSDAVDFFEFQGLASGTSFFLEGFGEGVMFTDVVNSSSEFIAEGPISSGLTGTIPGDGNLIVEMQLGGENSSGFYGVRLEAQLNAVPEPSALIPTALGAAGLLAWRRRRKK